MGTLIDDLRHDLEGDDVVCIAGTGVSVAASSSSFASWTGLLKSGVTECEKLAFGLPNGWADRVRAEIDSGDLDDLLSAAEKIARKLDAPTGGNFGRWLRETVGTIEIADPAVPQALRDLDVPLLTTNYDDVLRKITGLDPITWRDGPRVELALRGDEDAIVHLHGHWQRPDTITLGIRSYEDVLRNGHAQAMERALRTLKTLLFVGCKDGLIDPNFSALLQWCARTLPDSQFRHYVLARNKDVAELQAAHPSTERLYVLGYGDTFADLAPFLRSIAPAKKKA